MDDLIEALQILKKYKNLDYPICACHGELRIRDIDPEDISEEDAKILNELGFYLAIEGELVDPDDPDQGEWEDSYIYSFRFA